MGVIKMYYYKRLTTTGEIDSLHSCSEDVSTFDETLISVSEDEYNSVLAELVAKADAEQITADSQKQSDAERIAELETENAALLYQLLTGEELTDV